MTTQPTGRTLLYGLFRRRRMILGLAAGILATVLVGTVLWPPGYDASASIIVRGREYEELLFPEPERHGPWTVIVNLREEINSEVEIIRGRPVLERVVRALKLHEPREVPEPGVAGAVRKAFGSWLRAWGALLGGELREEALFETAVIRLRNRLRVEPATDSKIIQITYRDRDPVVARAVAKKVAEEYLEERLAINLNRAESSFYAEQVKAAEAELGALRNQLAALKQRGGIISLAEQSRAVVARRETFEVARSTVQREILGRRSKLRRVQEIWRARPELLIPLPEIAQNPVVQGLEKELVSLRLKLEGLRGHYIETGTQVLIAQEQLTQVERQIRKQVNEILEREEAELRRLDAEEQALTETIRRIDAEVRRLSAQEPLLSNLEKQIVDKEGTLAALRRRYQESVVIQASDLRVREAKLLSPASVPLRPAVPNPALNLGLGLILALVVSLSAALFAEYRDDSLRLSEDVERYLGRPAFASIPEL